MARGPLSPINGILTDADRAALYEIGAIALLLPGLPSRHERDSQPGRLGRLQARRHRGSGQLEPGGVRRAGAEVFPQGRRARAPEDGRGERRPLLALALDRRRGGSCRAPGGPAHRLRDLLQAGLRPPRRLLDLLGLEGRLFLVRGRRPGLLRRAALHAGQPDGGAELAAMVQHRPALGLRHRRARARAIITWTTRPAS